MVFLVNSSCGFAGCVGWGWGGGGGGVLASGIHIPNFLTNYPMKLHDVHEYYSRTSA